MVDLAVSGVGHHRAGGPFALCFAGKRKRADELLAPVSADRFERLIKQRGKFPTLSHLIQSAVRPKNELGSGTCAVIYRIPGLPELAYRFLHNGRKGAPANSVELLSDPFPRLNLGQAIARLGDGFLIKRQRGVQGGVPYGKEAPRKPGSNEIDWEARPFKQQARKIYKSHLKRLARLPQEAYDQLARQILALENHPHQYILDPSPNNLLIDAHRGAINVVDFSEKAATYQVDPYRRNDLAFMLGALLDNMYVFLASAQSREAGHREITPDTDRTLIRLRHHILKKAVVAALNTGLAVPAADMNPGHYFTRYHPDDSFEIAGLPGRWPAVRALLLAAGTRRMDRDRARKRLKTLLKP